MYQVLARKYRPRNFNELVGQSHVSRALTSALDRGRLHHAYLFTGTRGVGKTTIARILAKCLNCETGVTSTPCETCATCQAVNAGRFIDLIEIDAASRTKVEDTRELLDNVPYAPTQGRFKVYLIDEVHMLSTHSFNALLKTLEEPPAHVKFLFATTDPQKLPITVISRCLQFTLRPLAVDEITQHLTQILNTEAIEADQDALWQIGEAAQGSVRDALSLTDQAIAFGQGSIHHQDVKDMLGLIDRTIIYDLMAAIHQNQPQQVSRLLLQFHQQALDVAMVLDQLISALHELAMMQYLPDLSLKYSTEINQKIKQLAAMISAQDIQLYYQIACKGRADLQIAVTQEQGFEMTVLRLLAFRPLSVNEITVHAQTMPLAEADSQGQQLAQAPQLESQRPTQAQQQDSVDAATPTMPPQSDTEHPAQHNPVTAEVQRLKQDDDSAPESAQHSSEVQTLASSGHAELDQATVGSNATASTDAVADLALEHREQAPVQQTQVQQIESVEAVQTRPDDGVADTAATAPSSIEAAPMLELTSFDAEAAIAPIQAMDVAAMSDQDVFFLAPEADQRQATDQMVVADQAETTANVHSSVTSGAQPQATLDAFGFDLPQQSPAQPLDGAAEAVVENMGAVDANQMSPQQILALAPQQLEGHWTLEKWEYWFRSSTLPPAVQELAQQGVMNGEINGACVFHISKQYENLLVNAQYDLQQALIAQWPKTRFSLDFDAVSETTPFMLQQQRKQRAFSRATEMLHAEPVIQNLREVFDAQVQNIQLK